MTLVAALAVGGCTSAREASSGGAASASAVQGGSLTMAIALDASPVGVFQTLARNNPWIENVFQPLVRLQGAERQVQPVLATKVDVSSDQKTVTVTLRDGVTFHTGRAMTADDVKFTFETSAKPEAGSNMAFVAKAMSAIKVDSPTQLTITMSKPMGASLFDYLNQTLIVDKDTYSGLQDGSQVIGTGPFTFGAWKPGASFTLTKYPKYWDAASVRLDKVEYIVTTDPTAEVSAVRGGRAQAAWGLAPSDAQGFTQPNFNLVNAGGSIYLLGLNVTTAPLDNQKVRQAIGYAIDRDRINKQVFGGTGTTTSLVWAKGTPGITDAQVNHYTYDPAKAKQMITEAGAAGATVQVSYIGNPNVKAEYQIIANNLTEAGLKPAGNLLDQATFQAKQASADLGPAFMPVHGAVGLSPAGLLNALPTVRKGNPSHFSSPEYDQLQAAYTSASSSEADAALSKLTDYMLEQAFIQPILQAPDLLVVSSKVGGVATAARGPALLDQAYVTAG